MDGDSKPPLLALIFLFGFTAYLGLVETAIASVSKNKIKLAAERSDNRAVKVLYALDNFDKAITTILICHNVASITIATIITVFVTRRWSVDAVTLSTILTTIFMFFACEMLPKSIAKRYSYPVSLYCADLLYLLMKVLSPAAGLLTALGAFATKKIKEDEVSVTEDELQDIIEDMTEEGSLNEEQSELISNAVQFKDQTAEKILTPRVNITAIDIDDSPDEILTFIKSQTHSRMPVFKGSIDNIIGVLQIRKYMKKYLETGKAPEIAGLLDKVYYAPQETEINELLPLMSKHKINMAVIKDSYGGTLGIITVEDILEELVGDIWDESDVITEDKEVESQGIDLSEELEERKEGEDA